MGDHGTSRPSLESSSESGQQTNERTGNTSSGDSPDGERKQEPWRARTNKNLYRLQPGHGPIEKRPSTAWVQERLADCQWHNYEELARELATSDVELPEWKNHPTRILQARQVIRDVVNRNSYEVKRMPRGTPGKIRIEAVRKIPGLKRNATLRVCGMCGKSGLTARERVRRVVEYRVSKKSRNAGGNGDVIVGRVSTSYVCISCADHELEATGNRWRIEPPFDGPVKGGGKYRKVKESVSPGQAS